MPDAADLRSLLRSRLRAAAEAAGWGEQAPAAAAIVLELPREFAHGDLASPVAFSLAKALKKPPREVAEALAAKLAASAVPGVSPGLGTDDLLDKVEVAGGGYLNFFLGGAVWRNVLETVESAGPRYGHGTALQGEKILVEFVSANPTGPLLVVNARAASFGDALSRILTAQGATVEREYYVNDAGNQVNNLARSVEVRWRELLGQAAVIPEDGYHGEYVKELAAKLRGRLGDGVLDKPEKERLDELRHLALHEMIAGQQADLASLDVPFTTWTYEAKELHASGLVKEALAKLVAAGVTFEKDGAIWFKATAYGDEKDRVVQKTDGAPTYLLPDIAYHRHKFARGFSRLVNIVGSDHQVEMATLRAALKAIGEPVDRLEVIFTQFVSLKRGGEKVKMSKRAGDVELLRDLVDEVGKDATRFFFLMKTLNSPMEFDMDLAKSQSQDNPVYYLQYAHARLCSVIARAKEEGIEGPAAAAADPALLAEPETRLVLRKLARFPLVVEKAALGRAPHLLTHELLELAQAVHQFYTHNRVVGAESGEAARARLALVAAARQAISNGLELLGVTAPERM